MSNTTEPSKPQQPANANASKALRREFIEVCGRAAVAGHDITAASAIAEQVIAEAEKRFPQA